MKALIHGITFQDLPETHRLDLCIALAAEMEPKQVVHLGLCHPLLLSRQGVSRQGVSGQGVVCLCD